MIEVGNYEIREEMNPMILEVTEETTHDKQFWHQATKYASSVDDDEPFVNEMAYMMVTLHRTGA